MLRIRNMILFIIFEFYNFLIRCSLIDIDLIDFFYIGRKKRSPEPIAVSVNGMYRTLYAWNNFDESFAYSKT